MVSTVDKALEERDLHLTRYAMHAAIACKDRESNRFLSGFANYDRDKAHVELVLIQRLVEFYKGDYAAIPNRCSIVIYCSFSPCQECTSGWIPDLIGKLKPAEKEMRVRFVFEKYYTAANWKLATSDASTTDVRKMWDSDVAAQTAYNALRDKAGTLKLKESGLYIEEIDKTRVVQKWPRALEIKPLGAKSMSIINEFEH